jgi:phosphonoacetate hydrolase
MMGKFCMRLLRHYTAFVICLFAFTGYGQQPAVTSHVVPKQRVIIIMMDGFGPEYLAAADMPFLKSMMNKGFYKEVDGVMPSVTSVNNASINCGVFPAEHGIAGNTFYDVADGKEKLMEDSSLLLAPTIFERAKKYGIKSALFSSKLKTIKILSRGTDLAISPEIATESWIESVGPVPDKYSTDVNYWTARAMIHTLKTRPDIGLYYLHTTDYPMHMWDAQDSRSLRHLHTIDSLLQAISITAPDAAILITADHGMNHKNKVVDVKNALASRGISIVNAISPLKDLYPKHHGGFGGVSYVYLQSGKDMKKVRNALEKIEGIEQVYTRESFAKRFGQIKQRIGDLVVFGDKRTVFGELDKGISSETLPATYRTHGSLYELKVPLVIYNIAVPESSFFRHNLDIARWLF